MDWTWITLSSTCHRCSITWGKDQVNTLNSDHSWTTSAVWQGAERGHFHQEIPGVLGLQQCLGWWYESINVSTTWVPGPKASQRNIAQSITLSQQSCLLPRGHPGAISSQGKHRTCTRPSTWCNKKHNSSDMTTFFHMPIVGIFTGGQKVSRY